MPIIVVREATTTIAIGATRTFGCTFAVREIVTTRTNLPLWNSITGLSNWTTAITERTYSPTADIA
jgi:hypothetical protein